MPRSLLFFETPHSYYSRCLQLLSAIDLKALMSFIPKWPTDLESSHGVRSKTAKWVVAERTDKWLHCSLSFVWYPPIDHPYRISSASPFYVAPGTEDMRKDLNFAACIRCLGVAKRGLSRLSERRSCQRTLRPLLKHPWMNTVSRDGQNHVLFRCRK